MWRRKLHQNSRLVLEILLHYGEVVEVFERSGGYEDSRRIDEMLRGLGLIICLANDAWLTLRRRANTCLVEESVVA